MYSKSELHTQKHLVSVFKELELELEKSRNETNRLGWQQRSELIRHVYADYTNDDNLNEARRKWKESLNQAKLLEWIHLVFTNQRDEFGYFEAPEIIAEQLKALQRKAEYIEQYEVAAVLSFWLDKIHMGIEPPHEKLDPYTQQKKQVMYHWNQLIKELETLLYLAKKRGGTLGHRVGSIRARLIEMKSRIENY